VCICDEAASTNDLAKAAGLAGAPEGRVEWARRQTAGRGRQGRPWASDRPLGVWLSALVRPPWTAGQGGALALLGGLAVVEAVESLGLHGATLKWPNDVLVGARKLAGVLVETQVAGDRIDFAVIGVGLNVNQAAEDFPSQLREVATSLRQQGIPSTIEAAGEALIRALDRWYLRALADGPEAMARAWMARGGSLR
jgi:BirA family biotin operon repressor/biotin-[acetyl-CoA-carboxylase] ligase